MKGIAEEERNTSMKERNQMPSNGKNIFIFGQWKTKLQAKLLLDLQPTCTYNKYILI